ncbi:MAG TPA: hypothetical protein ENI07_16525 [Desulfobacterales bacterium]|nr:hypothetical protein [Desulfobacterales bacterium]
MYLYLNCHTSPFSLLCYFCVTPKAIHYSSSGSSGPLVNVNCLALSESLLERRDSYQGKHCP